MDIDSSIREKWLLEIEIQRRIEADETSSEESESTWVDYPVALNGTPRDSLRQEEIDRLYAVPNGQDLVMPTIPKFRALMRSKDFYNEINDALGVGTDGLGALLTVKSRDARILGLPWEVFLMDENQLVRRPNLLLRRCIDEIASGDQIDLRKRKLYITCFSKLGIHGDPVTDITTSICEEIIAIKELFPETEIKPDLTKEDAQNLGDEFSFVHYGGHGGAGHVEAKNSKLGASDLRSLKSELFFLNCCRSGFQTNLVNSLCYDLIRSGNFRFIVGMQYTVEDGYALEFARKFYDYLCSSDGHVLDSLLKTQMGTRSLPTTQSHLLSILYQG